MESAKQEKKNLMQDMPVDDKGSAMMKKGCSAANYGSPMKMGGSWMSKHCQSAINYGSPLNKKVTVTHKGKELTLDDRSQEYKAIMKAKKGKNQVDTKAVLDKSGTMYTGLTRN